MIQTQLVCYRQSNHYCNFKKILEFLHSKQVGISASICILPFFQFCTLVVYSAFMFFVFDEDVCGVSGSYFLFGVVVEEAVADQPSKGLILKYERKKRFGHRQCLLLNVVFALVFLLLSGRGSVGVEMRSRSLKNKKKLCASPLNSNKLLTGGRARRPAPTTRKI